MAHPVSGRGSLRSSQASFGDLDKPLYTISVAAEILETHPRTLMLYEDAGLIEPHRTSTNRRRYSQRDITKVQVIQHLTREKGVTLAGVRHILSLFETRPVLADHLKHLRNPCDHGAGRRGWFGAVWSREDVSSRSDEDGLGEGGSGSGPETVSAPCNIPV